MKFTLKVVFGFLAGVGLLNILAHNLGWGIPQFAIGLFFFCAFTKIILVHIDRHGIVIWRNNFPRFLFATGGTIQEKKDEKA